MNLIFSSALLSGICLATCAYATSGVQEVSGVAHMTMSVLYMPPPPMMPPTNAYGLPNMPVMPTGADVKQAIDGMRESLTGFQSLSLNNGITDVAAAYVEYVQNAVATNVDHANQNQNEMILNLVNHSTVVIEDFLNTPPMMVQEGWFFGTSNPNVVVLVATGGFFAP
jgi:hypothetical protein